MPLPGRQQTIHLVRGLYQTWHYQRVAAAGGGGALIPRALAAAARRQSPASAPGGGLRQYGIFRDIAKQVKGEIDSNPELKKSIEELNATKKNLAEKSREATETLYKSVGSVREEALRQARQVSAAVKEKVTEATEQVKGTVGSLKPPVDDAAAAAQDGRDAAAAQESTAGGSERAPDVPPPGAGAEEGPAAAFAAQEDLHSARGDDSNAGQVPGGSSAAAAADASSSSSSSSSSESSCSPDSSSSSDGASARTDSGASAGAGPAGEGESVWGRAAKGWSAVASGVGNAFSKVRETRVVDSVKQAYAFVSEELHSTGPSRRRKQRQQQEAASAPSTSARSDSTAVAVVAGSKQGGASGAWQQRWESLKEKVKQHPAYKRATSVRKHPVFAKSHELAEDIRERWETSDSPVVHRLQDMNESLFGETATAMAMKQIRTRDPTFNLPDFVAEVQEEVRPVLLAYQKADVAALRSRCSKELIERCVAEKRSYESRGLTPDSRILHISDVDLREMKLMGNEPIIILGFKTQQIHCAKDQLGNVVEGAKDEIHTVYYAWAMVQAEPEAEEAEVGNYQPKWKLREMQQLGVQALI